MRTTNTTDRATKKVIDATHKSVVVTVYFGEYERPLLGTVGDVHAIEHRLVLYFAVE